MEFTEDASWSPYTKPDSEKQRDALTNTVAALAAGFVTPEVKGASIQKEPPRAPVKHPGGGDPLLADAARKACAAAHVALTQDRERKMDAAIKYYASQMTAKKLEAELGCPVYKPLSSHVYDYIGYIRQATAGLSFSPTVTEDIMTTLLRTVEVTWLSKEEKLFVCACLLGEVNEIITGTNRRIWEMAAMAVTEPVTRTRPHSYYIPS